MDNLDLGGPTSSAQSAEEEAEQQQQQIKKEREAPRTLGAPGISPSSLGLTPLKTSRPNDLLCNYT